MKNGKQAVETRDFSVVEDSPEALAIITHLANEAGKQAAAEAKAMGLPQVFATDQYVISRSPDGSEEIIASAKKEGIEGERYFVKSPSTLLGLHAK